MQIALICERFKWSYQDYINAPTKLLVAITEMLRAEALESKRRQSK